MRDAPMTQPVVSVVVIGRNEGARLRRCLESLAAAQSEGLPAEIVYVDSGSSDSSPGVARGFGAKVILLASTHPTAAKARNAGWREATGSLVLFLDGDTVLRPGFVEQAVPSFRDTTIAVVWGHRRELYPDASIYNRVLDLDWIYAPGETAFCGGDALMRRQVLEATGGFDETLIAGEEPELCRRFRWLGFRILHLDLAMTGHDLAITRFGQYWNRAVRAGYAYAEVSERFRNTPDPFWLRDAARNRRHATVLLGLVIIPMTGALLLKSLWPLLPGALLLLLLAGRTAIKARWKSDRHLTLLLYGVHSHLQQLPILAGQLLYRRNRRQGRKAALLEYKASSHL